MSAEAANLEELENRARTEIGQASSLQALTETRARYLGRKGGNGQLFRKEAMAVVGLSWVLATLLGALPFRLSGTMMDAQRPMNFVDAMFEAQSGFSTTG